MTGIRVCVGYGKLARNNGEASDELPTGKTPLELLPSLVSRFGGAVTFSSSEARNVSLSNDIGLREPTVATQGLTQGSFSLNGYFSPQYCDWIKYAFHSPYVTMTSTSTFVDATGTAVTPTSGDVKGYVKNTVTAVGTVDSKANLITLTTAVNGDYGLVANATTASEDGYYVLNGSDPTVIGNWTFVSTTVPTVVSKVPILYGLFLSYQNLIAAHPTLGVKLFGYAHLNTAMSFDMGIYQINNTTDKGGNNEAAIYAGCFIDNFSISYENGGDSAVKWSIDGYYLRKYTQVDTGLYDYASAIVDPPDNILITGCLSKGTTATTAITYNAIAMTQDASFSVANNLQAIADCGKITYGTYALANVSYSVSTDTYSNDPNKYKAALYGYNAFLPDGTVYQAQKLPYCIKHMKIRSQDTLSDTSPTNFVDINMDKVYVGGLSHTYDVGSTIMDSPDLSVMHATIVVGYTPATN